jgi:hypothetical protein
MKLLFLHTLLLLTILSSVQAQRGRVQIQNGTLVTDRGTLIRGAYVDPNNMPTKEEVSAIKNLGLNCIHLYAENPWDDETQEPGYNQDEVDSLVKWTADNSLYLILTMVGWTPEKDSFVYDFWSLYAERYKDETHVIFEICNEPGPTWDAINNVEYMISSAIEMEKEAYNIIRTHAPETHILLLSPSNIYYDSLLRDIEKLGNGIDWSNASIAGHAYSKPDQDYIMPIRNIQNAGYTITVTEFKSFEHQFANLALTRLFEQEFVSYCHFIEVIPLVTDPKVFKSRVESSEVRWTPDFGTWPQSLTGINYASPFNVWKAAYYDKGSGWMEELNDYNIFSIQNNDYVAYYNIDFQEEPTSFEILYSSAAFWGDIEIHLDSVNGLVVGICPITYTGGWDIYKYLKYDISTPFEGIHNIYLVFKGDTTYGFLNLKLWYFGKSDLLAPQTPYHGTATMLPGKIEAEEYDYGGSTVSFLDLISDTNGIPFRNDEVNIDTTGDGSYCIAWTGVNEWLEYTVSCEQETAMDIQLRGACVVAGDKIRIKLNNQVLTIVNLPNTGGFQNWETVTIEDIRIPAGEDQILRIELLGGYFNLDWLNFVASETNSIDKVSKRKPITFYPNPANDHIIINTNEKGVVEIYNLHGKLLIQKQLSANDNIIPVKNLYSGSYVLKVFNENKIYSDILIIEDR